jgi:2-phospho-L-lactate guanylyltransferase
VSDRVVAVVPVRSLRGGKTRLAGTLTPEAREALSQRMLRHVLGQAVASGAVDRVVVVSPDEEALAFALDVHPSVVGLSQPTTASGLNSALDLGRAWAEADGARAMLVLFADLPRLTAADVRDLAGLAAPVALAPDRHGTGTNALRLQLPLGGAFAFAFGVGSAALHLAEARRLAWTWSSTGRRASRSTSTPPTTGAPLVDGEATGPHPDPVPDLEPVPAALCPAFGSRP